MGDGNNHPARNEVLIDGLTFSSIFDSGNLLSVEHGGNDMDGPCVYVVTAAPDPPKPNTPPHAPMTPTTWFHFSVSGAASGQELCIQVVNLIKHAALYDQDMRPVVRAVPSQKKWDRRTYASHSSSSTKLLVRQGVSYQIQPGGQFSIQFSYTVGAVANDTIFFAFSYPYSYTDLQRELRRLDAEFVHHDDDASTTSSQQTPPPRRRDRSTQPIYYHRETLVLSLDGRKVDLLTLSSFDNILDEREDVVPQLFPDYPLVRHECMLCLTRAYTQTPRPFQFQNKRVVFLTARVHPAETPSSFVADGALHFLLSHDPRAHKLLKECVFKIIPMLNPDGVARGHYRHDTLGANLNRHYIQPTMADHPTIFAAKAAILATCHTQSKLMVHVDLHAHAAKRGCFIYGNRYPTMHDQASSQVYPKLIGLNSAVFEYDLCNFTEQNMHLVEKRDGGLSKDGSARVALYHQVLAMEPLPSPAPYFYTLECNFNMGRRVGCIPHSGSGLTSTAPLSPEVARKSYVPKYTTASWENVGKAMMVAVLDWMGTNEWSRIPHSHARTMAMFVQEIRNQVAPTFDVTLSKKELKKEIKATCNKKQLPLAKEALEMKRFGCVGLPPATSAAKLAQRPVTKGTTRNNASIVKPQPPSTVTRRAASSESNNNRGL
ncbi:Aste57867_24416 [Aphanomyces stellatus]|uniref:Cytosolic carboxypeptidase-like protein 5 n=1 Tax=Aphanomyces stellatus TaxID=120398 RepID=A0A485LQF9_9STRA|nr:hypothetical protein As57867_024340 [Aphanomyces stellatus]VFU01056.1 Aste57867_24416 [Aphanomyces stellatus]